MKKNSRFEFRINSDFKDIINFYCKNSNMTTADYITSLIIKDLTSLNEVNDLQLQFLKDDDYLFIKKKIATNTHPRSQFMKKQLDKAIEILKSYD